jgi:antitoxin HicB
MKNQKNTNPYIGSNFDDFLEEEGIRADVESVAVKRVIAYQIAQLMEKQGLSKSEMARRMNTSRSSLNRLLDPENESITLQTMERAAQALGKRLRIELAA